jgi:mRNA interferase MazF
MPSRGRISRPIGRGDVVLVPFPFTDLSATKRRPAVVLWADPARADFLLAFVSSQRIRAGEVGAVPLLPTHPEFSLTGLAAPSTVRTTKLVTLSGTLLKRWLGRLGPLLTVDLDRGLVETLSINLVPSREEGRRHERARLAALHAAGGNEALLADLGLGDRL